jgi:hypothetical protein
VVDKSLKIHFELDLSKDSDRQLIEIITRVKALQAQGLEPSIVGAATETADPQMPSVNEVRRAGVAMTEAANELAEAIPDGGERKKLNTKERAAVAARARWARDKARKEGKPLPLTAKELKKKEHSSTDALDYSQAEQQSFEQFPQVDGIDFSQMSLQHRHDSVLSALMNESSHLPYPDGREIMAGTWERGEEAALDSEFENPLDDDFVRRVHEQADRFDQE